MRFGLGQTKIKLNDCCKNISHRGGDNISRPQVPSVAGFDNLVHATTSIFLPPHSRNLAYHVHLVVARTLPLKATPASSLDSHLFDLKYSVPSIAMSRFPAND